MTIMTDLEQETARIRANFLNRLGIDEKSVETQPVNCMPSRGSLLGKVHITQEPLKFEEEKEQPKSAWELFFGTHLSVGSPASSSPISSVCSSSDGKRDVRITFNNEVKVVPIPMRDEYSKRVKDRLWTNAAELHQNAQRNALEFAAEGWDWRTAMEDEYMYRDAQSGELIHPVHCVHFEEN